MYGYCDANHVCYVEPSGHATMAVIAGAGMATVGGAATGTIIIVGGTYYVSDKIDTYVDSKTTTYSRAASKTISQNNVKDKIDKKINWRNKGNKKNNNKSIRQMQNEVEKGKAPRGIDRVDKPHVQGQQPHVHFNDGTSLNMDGTIHDKINGIPHITNKIRIWLIEHGWKVK